MLKWLKTNYDKYISGAGGANTYDQVRLSVDIEEQLHQHQKKQQQQEQQQQQQQPQHGDELFDDDSEKTPILVLAYLFFIVIASVLGMGILGLPVKLSQSGFTPFLGSYTLCYVMQVLSLFFVIEILQRCYAIIRGENPSIIGLNTSRGISISNGISNSNGSDHSPLASPGSSGSSGSIRRKRSPSSTSSSSAMNNTGEDAAQSTEESMYIGGLGEQPNTEEEEYEEQHAQGIILTGMHHHDNHLGESQDFEKIDLNQSQSVQAANGSVAQVTPNLHYLGLKFLGTAAHRVFIFSVVLHFTAILISYGLAAAMAYSKLIVSEEQQNYFILPTIVVFTLIVIFGSSSLQHIITFFTFGKGTLLIAIVLITGVVANHVRLEISNDWAYVGRSFLISTVALGGASGVIPVVFPKIIFSRREMYKCYATVFSALTTVFLLNICWCWFLLRIIPQMPDATNPKAPNLYDAGKNSQIATIPLMKVIHDYYPQYLWIAWAVDIFIVISITISYITVGTGYKQTLDGFSVSWRSKSLQNKQKQQQEDEQSFNNRIEVDDDQQQEIQHQQHQQQGYNGSKPNRLPGFLCTIGNAIQRKIDWVNNQIDAKEVQSVDNVGSTNVKYPIREFVFYIFAFGFILTVALCNPKGFLMMLESGASLGLNLQAGLFAVLMLNFSRKAYSHFPIPLPLHNYIFKLRYIVLVYFSSAVLYDIFELIIN
ncbi:hypothetical protein PPL_10450 [Heterostelium album PN500]|uniref:Uncharacterized protein n=1 Tax=Heterostelium pallidum (strain ATCC 26659 / Pp 5 / PN500) TaxID=670386 RepID=D3BR46_HETP5|nr:hypothetical protein PPL_10450 [Heterostelium album PN500]EFA75878.1 hypothetical protein PPL_10450 [Heterostelium album PN500]|eukprot:XP_020428012.1 hypothetical protein PPL_10450 [Heterostelium album PN500]